MSDAPTSVVAAVALSAAAGKNPWIPLGLLFLLAAPSSMPDFVISSNLHQSLHQIASPTVLYTFATIFIVLAVMDSLADKVSFIERWLTPISTAWRPFAGVAVASIIGVSTATYAPQELADALGVKQAGVMTIGAVLLPILAGSFAGYLATVSKTGIRLILQMVPIPGLRLAHSFLDDFFAVGATIAGLAFSNSWFIAGLALVYLVVGLFTGPLLARLAWIHLQIGIHIFRKLTKSDKVLQHPKWLTKALGEEGAKVAIPAYTYHAPEVGRCRTGWIVLRDSEVWFVARAFMRTLVYKVEHDRLTRVGLSQSTTRRAITLAEREANGIEESVFHLFPAEEDIIIEPLTEGTTAAGLVRVSVASNSARQGLPGTSSIASSSRYVAATDAGSLRMQALVTVVAAVLCGVLSVGAFIPIGAGYILSPFKRRFAFGMAVTVYLLLCVVGSLGIGWPATVLSATLLNAVALRDLTRQALKARVDGYVDTSDFLPPVCERVWVPESAVLSPQDKVFGEDAIIADGPWRAAVRALADAEAVPAT